MSALWLIHLVRLLFLFQEQSTTEGKEAEDTNGASDSDKNEFGSPASSDFESGTPESVFYYRSNSEGTDDETNLTYINELQATYGSLPIFSSKNPAAAEPVEKEEPGRGGPKDSVPGKNKRTKTFKYLASRIQRVVVFYNVAIPVTL